MFDYSDPIAGSFLSNVGALTAYRGIVDRRYQASGNLPNSGFATLEAFDQVTPPTAITSAEVKWRAFPLSQITASDQQIDADRLSFQDEYVEWQVEKSGGAIARITFTTEFPEYYQAIATIGIAEVFDAIKELYPGANPTNLEVFGTNDAALLADPVQRATRLRQRLADNPWNNGKKGILCLMQQFNTMSALFSLVDRCAVPQTGIPVGSVCAAVGGFCGPNRDSDPQVCAASQSEVRDGQAITLADPVGVELVSLGGGWSVNGTAIPDINNDPMLWALSRNRRRGVLAVTPGLELDGNPIVTGAQVSKVLEVCAVVQVVANSKLPAWAQIGNEGTRGP